MLRKFYWEIMMLTIMASLVAYIAQLVKNLPARQKSPVQFLGWKDPWRREWLPTTVFLLKIPWTEEPGML